MKRRVWFVVDDSKYDDMPLDAQIDAALSRGDYVDNPIGSVMRTLWLRDGTVISGRRRMGAPAGPEAYVVENDDGRHTIMVDSVVRVLDAPEDVPPA